MLSVTLTTGIVSLVSPGEFQNYSLDKRVVTVYFGVVTAVRSPRRMALQEGTIRCTHSTNRA
ncbi:hypothetical protein MYSE111917_01130 [Mycobacterium senriense]